MMSYEASLKRKRDAESIRLTQERIAREREQNAFEKGFKEGFKQGFKQGFKEGIELERRTVAIKFKEMGMSLEDISKGTGLSVEEIEKL